MNLKSWKNFDDVKNIELNRILDKIHSGIVLSEIEKNFLNNFNQNSDDYYREYYYLSKNDLFNRLQKALLNNRKIICNLCDRDGKIGIEIKSAHNVFENESFYLILKNNQKIELTDNYLYNMTYDIKKNEYSIESQDEYHEKIPVKDEN